MTQTPHKIDTNIFNTNDNKCGCTECSSIERLMTALSYYDQISSQQPQTMSKTRPLIAILFDYLIILLFCGMYCAIINYAHIKNQCIHGQANHKTSFLAYPYRDKPVPVSRPYIFGGVHWFVVLFLNICWLCPNLKMFKILFIKLDALWREVLTSIIATMVVGFIKTFVGAPRPNYYAYIGISSFPSSFKKKQKKKNVHWKLSFVPSSFKKKEKKKNVRWKPSLHLIDENKTMEYTHTKNSNKPGSSLNANAPIFVPTCVIKKNKEYQTDSHNAITFSKNLNKITEISNEKFQGFTRIC